MVWTANSDNDSSSPRLFSLFAQWHTLNKLSVCLSESCKWHVGWYQRYVWINLHFSKLMWQFIADIDVYQMGAGQSFCHIYLNWCLPWNCFSVIRFAKESNLVLPYFLVLPAGCPLEHDLSIRVLSTCDNGNLLIFFVNKVSTNISNESILTFCNTMNLFSL